MDFSHFLRKVSITVNFLLRTAFASSHRFGKLCFHFRLSQGIFWFHLWFFSLTHWFFTPMIFYLLVFYLVSMFVWFFFPLFFLHLISSFILLCSHAQLLSHVQLFHELQSSRLLSPWIFPGKHIGVGCHLLLQGIFLIQGSNLHLLCLLHWHTDSFAYPPAKSKSTCYSKTSWAFGGVCVLDFGHFNRCIVIVHCCINWPFPDDIWGRAFFSHIYLSFVYTVYICKSTPSLVRSLISFFNQAVFFLLLSFKSS